jgi:hypothetical protein
LAVLRRFGRAGRTPTASPGCGESARTTPALSRPRTNVHALLLAMAGRQGAFDELSGDGVATLREHP